MGCSCWLIEVPVVETRHKRASSQELAPAFDIGDKAPRGGAWPLN